LLLINSKKKLRTDACIETRTTSLSTIKSTSFKRRQRSVQNIYCVLIVHTTTTTLYYAAMEYGVSFHPLFES